MNERKSFYNLQLNSSPKLKNYLRKDGLFIPTEVPPESYNNQYFSEQNPAYPEGYTLEERLAKYADVLYNIKNFLPPPILDLGSGPGFMVEGLLRNGVDNVYGIDISKEIGKFSPPNSRQKLINGSVLNLPFPNHFFQSGFSFHVLEHLTEEQIVRALSEITRVVSYKLYLIIPTWGEALRDPSLFSQIIGDPTHRVIATRNWWIRQFAQYGWSHIDSLANSLDRLNKGWVFFFER